MIRSINLALLLLLPASAAHAQGLDDMPLEAPPGRGLRAAGASILLSAWTANLVGTGAGELALPDDEHGWDRYALSTLPVVGPFAWSLWVLHRPAFNLEKWLAGFGIANSLVQLLGVALIIAGVRQAHGIGDLDDHVRLLPAAAGAELGLSLDVRF